MEPNRESDEAIALGAERVREAEERFLEEPPESPALVDDALLVQRRAEDVDLLTKEAAERAADEASKPVPRPDHGP